MDADSKFTVIVYFVVFLRSSTDTLTKPGMLVRIPWVLEIDPSGGSKVAVIKRGKLDVIQKI